jgi:GNAT superfamily N-acetyltransferase
MVPRRVVDAHSAVLIPGVPRAGEEMREFESFPVIAFEERHRGGCASVIQSLPDWFGIEASNRAYVAALGRLPTFVVEEEQRVLGFAALEGTSTEAAEIHVIAVAPDWHRGGIGRALVSHAEDWVCSRKLSLLHVKTLAASRPDPFYARTHRFYEAMGFHPLFESSLFWGPENPTLVLVKSVGGPRLR